jgi:uncharacterized protein with HEPN domain
MSKKGLRVNDYLDHILQAIERIERYTLGKDEAQKDRSIADRQTPRSALAGDGSDA